MKGSLWMSRETLFYRRGFFSEPVKDVFNLMGKRKKRIMKRGVNRKSCHHVILFP